MGFLKVVALFFTLCTLTGLYKPWLVFWWSDFSNRKKVIKWYGFPALVLWLLYATTNA